MAMSHSVTWYEIQVVDLEAAKTFYGEVFGWTFEAWGESFVVAMAGDQMVCGLDLVEGDTSPAGRHVRVYLDVDDMEETLARIEKAGGEVVAARTAVPGDNGWLATFADPSGLKLSLFTNTPAA
jgi:uncharacterized protein